MEVAGGVRSLLAPESHTVVTHSWARAPTHLSPSPLPLSERSNHQRQPFGGREAPMSSQCRASLTGSRDSSLTAAGASFTPSLGVPVSSVTNHPNT